MSDVSVSDVERVRWITLDRPESKNGLTVEVNAAIIEARRAAVDDKNVRVIALYGANGAFCSGLDLRAAAQTGTAGPADTEQRMRTYFHGMIRAIRATSKPVIAM